MGDDDDDDDDASWRERDEVLSRSLVNVNKQGFKMTFFCGKYIVVPQFFKILDRSWRHLAPCDFFLKGVQFEAD